MNKKSRNRVGGTMRRNSKRESVGKIEIRTNDRRNPDYRKW